MKKIVLYVILLLVSSTALQAQNPLPLNAEKYRLLSAGQKQDEAALKVTPPKAALFSAVVPGAGQFANGQYWKAAAFFTLEAGLWTANIIYDNKGGETDTEMRQYGELHWSEDRYLAEVYRDAVDLSLWTGNNLQVVDDALIGYSAEDRAMLLELQNDSRFGYTHILPETKTQQYYEMIYKYLGQFGVGWDDVPAPDHYEISSNLGKLTPHISKYRDLRNESNDYYQTATNMLNAILINHVISALEAGWSAKKQMAYFRVMPQYRRGEWIQSWQLQVRF